MKTLFTLLLFIAGGGSLCAQIDWNITTHQSGSGPAAVFVDDENGLVHVLTTGIDTDFDGVIESEDGDVSAGWYVYNADGTLNDSAMFGGFFNAYPVRAAMDFENGILYTPIKGVVASYSIETLEPLNETLIDEAFAMVSRDENSGLLMLSRRASDFTSPGEVVYVDPETEFVFGRIRAGINPGMGVGSFNAENGVSNYYTINEGTFGEADASLSWVSYAENLYDAVNQQTLGGGAADIIIGGEDAYVLLGSTHQVRILDLTTHEEAEISPIDIGTEGFDSPRALAVDGNTLIVGTYSSDIRRFSLINGMPFDTIPTPGKVEDIVVANGGLFAIISYSPGTYDTDSLLFVADAVTGQPLDTLVIGPGPAALYADPATGRIIVIGYGAGEEATPWWRVLDSESFEELASGQMNISLSFPLRAAFDASANQLAVVGSDSLYVADLATPGSEPVPLFSAPDAEGDLFGVSDGGDYWIVTERPLDFAPSPCYVHMVHKEDGEQVAHMRTGGDFILTAQMVPSAVDGLTRAYVLHEGNFNGTDALLGFIGYAPQFMREELGTGANHILHEQDGNGKELTAVTMNGGYDVVMLDLNGGSDGAPVIDERIPTGTSGFDGPRESVIAEGLSQVYENPMFVTTYSGELLFIADGEVQGNIPTGSKNEGVAILGNQIYVANAFDAGSFTPGNTISLLSIVVTSVGENEAIAATALSQNYPNPVQGWTTIPFSLEVSGRVAMKLYSTNGELVGELMSRQFEAGNHELLFDAGELESGSYIYTLQVGNQTLAKRMEILR